jgi:hypothetical protein
MRLFDELFCLCLVDTRKMDIKPDRELKSWQRISRPIRVVCGLLVDLTECDMARHLNIAELFVLLVGHKTNRISRGTLKSSFTMPSELSTCPSLPPMAFATAVYKGWYAIVVLVDVFCHDQKSRDRVDPQSTEDLLHLLRPISSAIRRFW